MTRPDGPTNLEPQRVVAELAPTSIAVIPGVPYFSKTDERCRLVGTREQPGVTAASAPSQNSFTPATILQRTASSFPSCTEKAVGSNLVLNRPQHPRMVETRARSRRHASSLRAELSREVGHSNSTSCVVGDASRSRRAWCRPARGEAVAAGHSLRFRRASLPGVVRLAHFCTVSAHRKPWSLVSSCPHPTEEPTVSLPIDRPSPDDHGQPGEVFRSQDPAKHVEIDGRGLLEGHPARPPGAPGDSSRWT